MHSLHPQRAQKGNMCLAQQNMRPMLQKGPQPRGMPQAQGNEEDVGRERQIGQIQRQQLKLERKTEERERKHDSRDERGTIRTRTRSSPQSELGEQAQTQPSNNDVTSCPGRERRDRIQAPRHGGHRSRHNMHESRPRPP